MTHWKGFSNLFPKTNTHASASASYTPPPGPPPPAYQAVPTQYFLPPKQSIIPSRPGEWPMPTLRLRVDDLSHPGAQLFFQHVNPYEALRQAVLASFNWLYMLETVPRQVEVIQLVLRSMPGVAHTTGSDIYKEIHFSLEHIMNCSARAKDEINGVLTHEVVHCFQYNGSGRAPSGLIEGVADWVRLRASLAAPHWRRRTSPSDKWDQGYDGTAYFLDFLETQYGRGIVRALNLKLGEGEYEERSFWEGVAGESVETLWGLYCACVEGEKEGKEKEGKEEVPPPVPTHVPGQEGM